MTPFSLVDQDKQKVVVRRERGSYRFQLEITTNGWQWIHLGNMTAGHLYVIADEIRKYLATAPDSRCEELDCENVFGQEQIDMWCPVCVMRKMESE